MSEQPARDPVIELLDNTRHETGELVSALCEAQAGRMRDMVAGDMRDQVLHILESRFAQLELTMRPRMARARLEVARGISQVLHECFTRMRRFESDFHWCEAMLDAAGAMSRCCAFFSVRGRDLCFQGARGVDSNTQTAPPEVPYQSAPAFDRVIGMARTFSVIRSAAELSAPIAGMFGQGGDGRALLVPIIAEDRVPGILYAEDTVDPSAMELIAAVAGAILEKHLKIFASVRSAPGVSRSVAVRSGDPLALPMEVPPEVQIAASAPPRADDPVQVSAQRFARAEVARMLLAHPPAVSRGRRARDLYSAIGLDIDILRAAYRSRYRGVRDYVHLELVRTLALGDESLLGRDYPGPIA